MSHLKAFKLTSATPVRAAVDPVQRSRERMIAALAEQKQMAEAKIAGQAFTPTHIVRRKNAEGVRVEVEAPKRVRQGLFTDGDGKVFFASRYAGKPIEFARTRMPSRRASFRHCRKSSTRWSKLSGPASSTRN